MSPISLLSLPPSNPSCPPSLYHIVVCVHGLCIYVLWLISSSPSPLILRCQSVHVSMPLVHQFVFFIRFHV